MRFCGSWRYRCSRYLACCLLVMFFGLVVGCILCFYFRKYLQGSFERFGLRELICVQGVVWILFELFDFLWICFFYLMISFLRVRIWCVFFLLYKLNIYCGQNIVVLGCGEYKIYGYFRRFNIDVFVYLYIYTYVLYEYF